MCVCVCVSVCVCVCVGVWATVIGWICHLSHHLPSVVGGEAVLLVPYPTARHLTVPYQTARQITNAVLHMQGKNKGI